MKNQKKPAYFAFSALKNLELNVKKNKPRLILFVSLSYLLSSFSYANAAGDFEVLKEDRNVRHGPITFPSLVGQGPPPQLFFLGAATTSATAPGSDESLPSTSASVGTILPPTSQPASATAPSTAPHTPTDAPASLLMIPPTASIEGTGRTREAVRKKEVLSEIIRNRVLATEVFFGTQDIFGAAFCGATDMEGELYNFYHLRLVSDFRPNGDRRTATSYTIEVYPVMTPRMQGPEELQPRKGVVTIIRSPETTGGSTKVTNGFQVGIKIGFPTSVEGNMVYSHAKERDINNETIGCDPGAYAKISWIHSVRGQYKTHGLHFTNDWVWRVPFEDKRDPRFTFAIKVSYYIWGKGLLYYKDSFSPYLVTLSPPVTPVRNIVSITEPEKGRTEGKKRKEEGNPIS